MFTKKKRTRGMRFDISTKKKPQSLVFAHSSEVSNAYLETDCEQMSNGARFGNDVMCDLYESSKINQNPGEKLIMTYIRTSIITKCRLKPTKHFI